MSKDLRRPGEKGRKALYKIRITGLDVKKGPDGNPLTRVSFDVLRSRFGKQIKRSSLYKPGKPLAFVRKGAIGLVLLDDGHFEESRDPSDPGSKPSAQSFNYVTIWLWTSIAEAPGKPGDEPPPTAGPAETPTPPDLGGGVGGPGLIIAGPGGITGGGGVGGVDTGDGGTAANPGATCEEAGEPGSPEYEDCMELFATPDLDTGGGDTGGGGQDTGGGDQDTGGGGEDTGGGGDTGSGGWVAW